jgi:Calcineurin-like phosphoesterase
LVCEAKLQESSDAWIGADHLPPRPENPQNVIVLGDTGCRVVYWQVQPCRSGVAWPFAAVAMQAASKIRSDDSQSIIIDVGDFHYRENPCADTSPECGGSPYGDNWATWEKEFFEPASPLLLAAPWVIMRGNHENCARAGAGWIFLFGLPGITAERACQNDLPSYNLSLGKAGDRRRVLTVLDTANAHDEYSIAETCKAYRKWIDAIGDDSTVVWLALHQPLLARSPGGWRHNTDADDDHCEQGQTNDALKVIRAMLLSSSPARQVRLLLAGDLHVFQFFQSSDPNQPLQIIAGMGGTKLDKLYKLLPKDSAADQKPQPAGDQPQWDQDVTSFGVSGAALTIARHGFVSMHRNGQAWTVTMLDVNGEALASCHFSELPGPSRPATAMPDCDGNPSRLVRAPSNSASQGTLAKSPN